MRTLLGILHRWLGLATALFLFVAGATGAVISWDHEIDAWLNPELYEARTQNDAAPLPSLELAARVEAADPRVQVTYLPLDVEPHHALQVSVEPRIDPATGQPYEPGYNQVALDPITGEIQGKRMWGDVSLARENLLPFLYKLHYSLHIPEAGGVDIGSLFMGIVAIVWVLDGLIALWLSFPNLRSWRKSFAFRWKKGGHARVFDLHRSGGVWIWLLLLIVSITAVSMNLRTQVVVPIVATFSTLTPNPFDIRTPAPIDKPIEPVLTRAQAIDLARAESVRRGWTAPAGAVFYAPAYGVYGIGFFTAGNDHGDGGLGNPWLYFDGRSGEPAGDEVPGTGSAGDIFLQAQFPLHSGRILGITGRVMMTLLGIAIAALSVTGIVIWLRKKRARAFSQARRV